MADHTSDDTRIVARIASGDREALGALYVRYASLLLAVSLHPAGLPMALVLAHNAAAAALLALALRRV